MDKNKGPSELDALSQRIEELLRGKQNFQNMAEVSVHGIMIHRNFRLLFVNQSLAEVFGYDSPQEMQAIDDVTRIIAPEELPRLKKLHEARLRGDSLPSHYDFIGVRKDGTHIRVEHNSSRVDWDGEVAVQTILLDVSVRHEAEEALRANQRLLQTVLDTIPHWVFVKDLNGRFMLVNSAFANSHDADPSDSYQMPLFAGG